MMEQKPLMTLKDLMARTRRLRLMGMCPACEKEGPFEFKSEFSRVEFSISGLCQGCQDELLKEENVG